ncbi:hypothetical protein DL93DRAFT_2115578, partial [Clavulina sp. PMI_390]
MARPGTSIDKPYPIQRQRNQFVTPKPTIDSLNPRPQSQVVPAMLWSIKKLLISMCQNAKELDKKLGDIPSKLQLPAVRTPYRPVVAINEKCSTTDGNISVLRNWMEQTGIDQEVTKNTITLVHGDLGVLERVRAILKTRARERTDWESFEYIEAAPGLFHTLMAAANAVWRTYLEPKSLQKDLHGVYQHFAHLYPKDHAKLKSNAPFRMLHDGLQHTLLAHLLEYAREILNLLSANELEERTFKIEEIDLLAKAIYNEYIAHAPALSADASFLVETEEAKLSNEEKAKQNSRLFVRDALLYQVLAVSMKHGAVGTVEDVLWYWIPIFKATRKHKYAAYLLDFLTRLSSLPPELARAIRLNWLLNPTGRHDGFRAVDWVIELNNLYLKAVYSGSGPNKTIEHILSQSGIIELLRSCHENIEDNFEIRSRTIRHAPADMAADIAFLAQRI